MGDFVNTGTTKTAVRELASQIADLNSFTTLIQGVIDDNPWECTSYESGGETLDPVIKSREYYSGKVVYENTEAKVVGQITVRAPTAAAFNTNVSTILANAALTAAMGGTSSHDSSEDKFTCTLRCHSEDGELYSVTFQRDKIRISSYESDVIRTDLDTWADGITALA